MTETIFYKKHIKPYLEKQKVFFCRIDSQGIPDIYTCKNGRVIWIEMKCVNELTNKIKPKWRPGQMAFIREHKQLCGDCVFLALWVHSVYYFLPPREFYFLEQLEKLKIERLNYE
jgi:hypothetical protein